MSLITLKRKSPDRHATVLPTAIGDTCAILPVLREISDNYLDLDFTFFAPAHLYRFVRALAAEHCYTTCEDANVHIRHDKFRSSGTLPNGSPVIYAGRRYHGNTDVTNLRRHMTEQAFITMLDASIQDLQPRAFEYLQSAVRKPPIGLPTEQYIAVASTNQYPNRAIPSKAILDLRYAATLFGYRIVWVGAGEARFPIDEIGGDLDLTNKTKDVYDLFNTLRAENVVGFFGPDCGIGHVAACVKGLPTFTYYSLVNPVHRKPVRYDIPDALQVVVSAALDCVHCQTKAVFDYEADFRTCIKDPENLKPDCARNRAWSREHTAKTLKWVSELSSVAR